MFLRTSHRAVVPGAAILATLAGLILTVWLLTPSGPTPAQPKDGKAADKNGEIFGYTQAFEDELKKIGQISPAQFAAMYPSKGKYSQGLTWDPTTAKFFDEFQADPKDVKAKPKVHGSYDFRLNEAELAAFKKNGFVVSERMGAASFGEMFYRIYGRDLPVYISADSILHAWHRSFDGMVEELEEGYLANSLGSMLSNMAKQLPKADKEYGTGVLGDSVRDADYFIAVAQSLLQGTPVKTVFNQEERVAETLKAVAELKAEKFNLFGRERDVDFSQFKVRGHYENSELLKKYFKAVMWCGRTDLRIAGGKLENGTESSPRELGAALVLLDLIQKAEKFDQWQQFDHLLQTFVGKTDSATFAHLQGLADKVGLKSPAQIKNLDDLAAIQKDILAGKIGLQHIRGDIVWVPPFGIEKAELPRSFTFLGQKFVMDSWVTAKLVDDDVIWNDERVHRRVPSGLDVAFSVLGNNQTVPLLLDRINNKAGMKFRDGLNYQHNLAAVRNVIDAQDPKVWSENLYMHWLNTLRELSKPTTDTKYPEVMRTEPWAMKTLNTQLASWTQLRHDTILYVKQSYTAGISCYYPAGFVEALPHFWQQMETMATSAATLIEKTPFGAADKLQHKQVTFLKNFAKQVSILRGIAVKELDQKALSDDEAKFLKNVVQINFGCGGPPSYNGWYPSMFYRSYNDCGKWDALVADVHTDVPSPVIGDPGCVLNQAVGNVDLMLIAVDNGKDRMVYAGPVLSHYEFETPAYQRKSDSEWKTMLSQGKTPPRPSWTTGYLVQGTNPNAAGYVKLK